MQKVRWQTCNVLGFKQCWFQCFKRDQKSVAKLGKESRSTTTLPSGAPSSVYGGSPTGCPSAGVCQKPTVCFVWKGQSPHCAQRSHGHPADEQQTEAEKWSLNPPVPFTQMQSLCAVLSKDRMRRADTRPADGLSETGWRAEHCTAGSLQWMALFLPREPGTACVSSETTPQTTMPPTAFTSHGAEPPLLSVPIRFKGSKLTEHNTQHLGKYSGNNISFLLETKTKEASPEFYVVTNNS